MITNNWGDEEELENGTIDREVFENWIDNQAELQLMENE